MNVNTVIEKVQNEYKAVLWWQADERALVCAGSEVPEVTVVTEFTANKANKLGSKLYDRYFQVQSDLMGQSSGVVLYEQGEVEPVVIDVNDRMVSGVFQIGTME